MKGGGKLKILITSVGVTGKSSFLKWLEAFQKTLLSNVFALDFDHQRDKLPKEFDPETIYVFEDVHGPTRKSVIPLKEYDLVLYLLPSWFTHLKFWLDRMIKWYENGNYAWDADVGQKGVWAGTGKQRDWRNIPGIFKYFRNHFAKRGKTIKEDIVVLKNSGIPTYIVIPSGKREKQAYTFKPL